jgi:HSP20 family protein
VSTRKSGRIEDWETGRFVEPDFRHTPPDKEVHKMKAISLYHPNTFHNALNDLNRYFDSFFVDSIPAPEERVLYYSPAVDIQENENSYVMKMELPGFNEKNIEVNVDGPYLSIVSRPEEKKEKKDDEDGIYILRERGNTTFNRSFQLPGNADPMAVSAAFKDGILSLNIKKRAETNKRVIEINAA